MRNIAAEKNSGHLSREPSMPLKTFPLCRKIQTTCRASSQYRWLIRLRLFVMERMETMFQGFILCLLGIPLGIIVLLWLFGIIG